MTMLARRIAHRVHHRIGSSRSRQLSHVNKKKYEEITVGIPKERFPLEKRVAATPEVCNDVYMCVYTLLRLFGFVLMLWIVDCVRAYQGS